MALLSPYGFFNVSGEVKPPLFGRMIHTHWPCLLIGILSHYDIY